MKLSKKILTVLSCIAIFTISCKSEQMFSGKSYSVSEFKSEKSGKKEETVVTFTQSKCVFVSDSKKNGKVEATYTKDSINANGVTTFKPSTFKINGVSVDATKNGYKNFQTDSGLLQSKIKITDNKNGTMTIGSVTDVFTYEVDTETKTLKLTDSTGDKITISYADNGKTLTLIMNDKDTKTTMTFKRN